MGRDEAPAIHQGQGTATGTVAFVTRAFEAQETVDSVDSCEGIHPEDGTMSTDRMWRSRDIEGGDPKSLAGPRASLLFARYHLHFRLMDWKNDVRRSNGHQLSLCSWITAQGEEENLLGRE